MIHVKCLGHIGTTLGAGEVDLPDAGLEAADLVDKIRGLTGKTDPGFSKYNTIVMVEDGEAFVPAGRSAWIADGGRVALIPFSHGG